MSHIIDAHTHMWNRASGDYDWITPEYAAIDFDYGIGDLREEASALGVDQFVLVQAADTAGDTDRMLDEAEKHPEVAGVVAWMPLDDPALTQTLEQRLQNKKIVGVRALIHNMADTRWVLRDEVAAGLDMIASAGLSFDFVTSGPSALALIPSLVQRHPSLRIIIDHLGKPPVGGDAEECDRWRGLLSAAANAPTVAAKLSGLATTVDAADPEITHNLTPIIDHALNAFGPERLMYGGDWPLCLLGGNYTGSFNQLHASLDVSVDEREQIHNRTATSWYRLDER